MSSSVFRQIAPGGRPERAEQLFNAAIAAFCALTRPTRAEAAQVDDLTLSLLQHVSAPCRRYAAAALSECAHAPPGLVRRLCDEAIEIAAPLLARSPVLDASDLVALIDRHGLPHARAIAGRPDLAAPVAKRVEALMRQDDAMRRAEAKLAAAQREASGEAAENARRRLRGMMRGVEQPTGGVKREGGTGFAALLDTALLDHRPFFETALADALGLGLPEARAVAADLATLTPALHALGLSAEQAFVIAAAAVPQALQGKKAIRSFLDEFTGLGAQTGRRPPKDSASCEPARLKRA